MKTLLFICLTLFINKSGHSQSIEAPYSIIKKMRENIITGSDFEAYAAIHSNDTTSAKRGGDIGLIKVSELKKNLRPLLKNLKIGELSEIIEEEYGYYLYKLVGRENDALHLKMIYLKK